MSDQAIRGFHHIALRVPDLNQAVRFYTALGFHAVHDWQLPDYAIERAVMMQASDGHSWLELFDLDAEIPMQGAAARAGAPVTTGAMTHLCLSVTDLARAMAQAEAAGARRLHGPEELSLGAPPVSVRNAIFEGPSGEIIELLAPVCFPGDLPPR